MSNVYYEEEIPEPACYERLEDYKMPKVTNEQLHTGIRELRIVLLGVEGSEDMGLYGEVRDMVKLQKQINGTVRSDHAWIGAISWSVGLLAMLLIGSVTASKIMGIW